MPRFPILGMPVNIGICAVIGFFIISGTVMTHLIYHHYGKFGKSTLYFYLDRFLRIYPQFMLFLVLSQICDLVFDFQSPYLASGEGVGKFLIHTLLVPLNYSMWIPEIKTYLLLPQAWSLALEEQFYWLFPLFVIYRWPGRIVSILSLLVFMLAASGKIHPEYYTFRVLPGVMFIFLMGKFLMQYNLTRDKESLLSMILLYLSVLVILLQPTEYDPAADPYKWAVGLGVLVFFPIIALLSKLKRKKWDDWLGNASYGIFLSHMLVTDLMIHFQITSQSWQRDAVILAVLSITAGFAGFYLVEKLVTPLRYRLRRRHSQSLAH